MINTIQIKFKNGEERFFHGVIACVVLPDTVSIMYQTIASGQLVTECPAKDCIEAMITT